MKVLGIFAKNHIFDNKTWSILNPSFVDGLSEINGLISLSVLDETNLHPQPDKCSCY